MTTRGKLQNGSDQPTDDHRPTGQAEELIAPLPGQQQKRQTEWQGDSIMCEAAEDTHQEHEAIGFLEVLATDTVILGKEERNDTLGTEFDERILITREE